MITTIMIDKAGRIVIPKTLRDDLCLEPGDKLSLKSKGESVVLRPVRQGGEFRKKRGIWTYKTGQSLSPETTRRVLRNLRTERERRSHIKRT